MSPSRTDDDRHIRLGQLISARRGHLGLHVEPTARAQGMSKDTWRKIEEGQPTNRANVYGRIERALQWPEGSIASYLRGGPEPSASGLLARVPDGEGGTIEIHEVEGDLPGMLPAEYWALSDDDRAMVDQLRASVDQVIRRLAATDG